ncbi:MULTISPECIES: DUF2280 domain-containing protein [unclassified Pseudomonas]|uniref:DUF2280 domain-containing protein n=1 Tax=unclassified Pseudomonas TaxID=196821 RepID=UPI000BC81580|nr:MULTISPECIES: DUF2280 domain-containing protein [unclassified Pseudomonas]PVZ19935.1 hypothetical protein F474_00526 [Pseudomonas sp. URIL14HWK12:I12]PVZ27001.1 hypothetical protein F470_00181 [Pseudomonas sp. URIL14HWK12:I10]PVZ37890.1 hypothetical protein F472_00526 [Pseudomonas sp. URIL14HWK12:I11]SNZ05258.1 hypothetical protein SAMN05660463_00878 [Pseudomonas sp. URIL14HWK12:I9]
MATLSNEVKAFIVQALACFDTPSQVAAAVRDEFGIEVTRQKCEAHDPTKRAGRDLAKRWVVLFNDTRERFRTETAEIPIANRAYRLRALGRFVEKAEGMRNIALAMQALEQAAKECGDAFVNHRPKPEANPSDVAPTRVQVDVVDARKPDADA